MKNIIFCYLFYFFKFFMPIYITFLEKILEIFVPIELKFFKLPNRGNPHIEFPKISLVNMRLKYSCIFRGIHYLSEGVE